MRNNQNKHGPDVDIGVWYAALLRHSDAASDGSGDGTSVRAGPVECGIRISRKDAKTQGLTGISDFRDQRSDSDNYRNGIRIADLLNLKSEIRNPKWNRPPERDWPPGSPESHKRRRRRPGSTIVSRRTGESPPGIVDDLITSYIDSKAQRKRNIGGCKVAGAQTTILTVMGGFCPEGRKRQGDKEMERWKDGKMERRRDEETRGQGDEETKRQGEVETRRWRDGETKGK